MILLIIPIFILIFVAFVTIFMKFSPQFGAKSEDESLEKIENSPNFKNGKFQNKNGNIVMGEFKFKTILKFFEKGNKEPDWQIPVKKINKEILKSLNDSDITVFWLGHSSVLMKIGRKTILFDPVFGNTVSPISFMGPKRFSRKAIEIKDLSFIDAIIISHDHYDHLDYKSILELKDKTGHFFVPLGVAAHLKSWGVDSESIMEFDWRDSACFENFTFTAMPARHFSGRGLGDRFSTLWSSWVIQWNDKKIFFGGDSGFDENISKEIGEKFGPFDLTILECGQYNEQWHTIHSYPEELTRTQVLLKGKLLLPIHWAAFKLSIHDWNEPIDRLLNASEELNIEVTTPMIGEPVVLGKAFPKEKWWVKSD